MTARRSLTGLLSLAFVAGCSVEVDFNPQGSDVSLEGEWTINGLPANVETCDDAGIDFVGLKFFHEGQSHTYDSLVFPCEDGAFSTAPVIEYGRYDVQWQAFDLDENDDLRELGVRGERFTLDVRSVEHVILLPVDFVSTGGGDFDPTGDDASLEVDWDVDGAAPTTTSCEAADIAAVQIVFYAENDTTFSEEFIVDEIPCDEGKYNSMPDNVLAEGRYMTSLVAIDADDNIVGESTPLLLVVDTSLNTHYRLQKVNFVAPTPTLRLALSWDTNPSSTMAGASCAVAEVDEFAYRLYLDGDLVEESEMIECTDELVLDDLEPGEYTIDFDGENADNEKLWMGTCDGLIVENGVETYTCEVDMVAAP